MNAKNIFRNIRGLAMSALLLIPAAFVSCSDDDTEGGSPYFRLENTVVSSKLVTASSDLGFDAEAIIGDATLELIRYDIRSNCNWSVECNSTDGDWIKFYPKTGQGDGKVRRTPKRNCTSAATYHTTRWDSPQKSCHTGLNLQCDRTVPARRRSAGHSVPYLQRC